MTSRFILVSTFLTIIALCQAQTQTPGGDTTFRSDVREVIVPVTVTNEKGHFVSNLEQKDFQIFEENKLQQIRTFTRDRNQPTVIGFLLDISSSSRNHWENFQSAATQLVRSLLTGNPNYTGYLIDYSQDAEVSVSTTSDPDAIVDKIAQLKPAGGAALYDAIFLACTSRKLVEAEPIARRRILIIIGDGHDNASSHSLAQALELAQRNLVTVYGIGTQAFGLSSEGDGTLQKLASETGGRIVYPLGGFYRDTDGSISHPSDNVDGVEAKLNIGVADIAGELTSQYLLFYTSDNPKDKTYRRLRVTVDMPNVRVRSRKGYFAAPPGS